MHRFLTANQIDIDAGKLAASRASSQTVQAFGQQMVTDHTNVNKVAAEPAATLGVAPADNATS